MLNLKNKGGKMLMRYDLIRKSSAFLVVILFIVVSAIPSFAIDNSPKADLIKIQSRSSFDIDGNITSLMKEGKIPSLSACIIKNDSMVWYGGYGYYNLLRRKTPSKGTLYMVCSISKAIAATALMQLYEKGLFDLDDDVSDYLPFVLRNPNYPNVSITFRMLLSHQSSLSHSSNRDLFLAMTVHILFPNKFPYPIIKELLIPGGSLYCPDVWTKNKPGEAFNYSNTGFDILQYLVERLSYQSFDNYCKENILKPLKMYNSSFNLRDSKRINRAIPYVSIGNFFVRIPFYPFYDAPDKATGGLITSVEDLSHFLIAHMNNGTYDGVRILNQSSIELMHTIHYYHELTQISNFQYGLGWMFFNISGMIYQGHAGGEPGFRAHMIFNETNKIGIILLFNAGKLNEVFGVTNDLIEMLFLNGKGYEHME